MRNYVQIFAGVVFYTDTTAPGSKFSLFTVQATVEDLNTDMTEIADSLSFPFAVIGVDRTSRYVLLDKYNLTQILRLYIVPFLQNPFNNGFQWFDTQVGLIWPSTKDDSPRGGWTDGTGNVRKAPPSDKSAKASKIVGPETLLQSLQTFAGAIIAKGFAVGGARYNPNTDPILKALTAFISQLARGLKIDMAALGLLLKRIEAYLA